MLSLVKTTSLINLPLFVTLKPSIFEPVSEVFFIKSQASVDVDVITPMQLREVQALLQRRVKRGVLCVYKCVLDKSKESIEDNTSGRYVVPLCVAVVSTQLEASTKAWRTSSGDTDTLQSLFDEKTLSDKQKEYIVAQFDYLSLNKEEVETE
jgi:hypothetical protein